LLSFEALELARDRLSSRGVLSINMIGSTQHDTYMTASVIKTLEAAFDQVKVFPASKLDETAGGVGNLAIMAYQGDPRPLRVNQIKFQAHPKVLDMVFKNLDRQIHFPPDTPAIILTDDYNPIDFYDGWLRERVRKNILESTDWDILIS